MENEKKKAPLMGDYVIQISFVIIKKKHKGNRNEEKGGGGKDETNVKKK